MMILEALTTSELLEILHKIIRLNLSDLTKTLTLFKVFLTKCWISNKILSIYSHKFLYELGCLLVAAFKQIIGKSGFILAKLCSFLVLSSYGIYRVEEEQNLSYWE